MGGGEDYLTIMDRPARALIFDLAIAPLNVAVVYLLTKVYVVSGMVIAFTA